MKFSNPTLSIVDNFIAIGSTHKKKLVRLEKNQSFHQMKIGLVSLIFRPFRDVLVLK